MRAHDVAVNDVMETTSEALDFGLLTYTSAAKTRIDGMIDTPNQRLVIEHVLPTVTPEDVARLPIKGKGGTLRLSDVAKVVWDTPLLIGDAVINDGAGLMLIVEKLPWANTLEVTRGVEAALEALARARHRDRSHHLPAGDFHRVVDRQPHEGAHHRLGARRDRARRIPLRVARRADQPACHPAVAGRGRAVLYMQDATINTMVLAGFVVALGSIVDDAIIDVENIVRRLRQNRREGSGKSTAAVVLEASMESAAPSSTPR